MGIILVEAGCGSGGSRRIFRAECLLSDPIADPSWECQLGEARGHSLRTWDRRAMLGQLASSLGFLWSRTLFLGFRDS
jgi:hypothetical protein